MKENFIEDLKFFEKKNKIKIDIITDNSLIIPEYIINLKNRSKKIIKKIEFFTKLKNLKDLENENKEYKSKKLRKKKFFTKKFVKKKTK